MKKAFTLIELIGVIILLGIIAILAFPPVLNLIRGTKDQLDEASKKLIYAASSQYTSQYKDDLPLTNGNVYCITLTDLIKEEYLTKALVDENKETLSLTSKVKISINNNQYEYVMDDKCVENKPLIIASDELKKKVIKENTLVGDNGDGLYKVTHTDKTVDYRYIGKTVNNYITFNGEPWRIIGIFDGKLKLIKAEKLPTTMAWDTKNVNNWKTSSLQAYLNIDYYNSLKAEAKTKIATVSYNLGGSPSMNMNKEGAYLSERGTNVFAGNPPVIENTKIALMYPSDYGYAAKSTCTVNLENYNDTLCVNGNWIYNTSIEWALSHNSGNANKASFVYSAGFIYNDHLVNSLYSVRPVLYLHSQIEIISGDGSSANPYVLK
ncbi:MAG: DUF6273 domain-containing protein [Bacilli bacterium]